MVSTLWNCLKIDDLSKNLKNYVQFEEFED